MGFWDGRAAVDWDFSASSAESTEGGATTERQRADIVEATLITLGLPRPNLTKIMPPSMRIRFRKPTAMLETRLTDAASMDFNISFSGNGLRTAWLQRQYLQQHPAVRVGAVAILQWAKARGLSDSRNGFLTPHAVVILWLHYLVQDGHVVRHIPPETAVPDPHLLSDVRALYSPLEPVDSPHVLGDMIVGFLRYYATTFPWETHVVTINHRNAIPKSDLGFQDSIIAIQDPIMLSNISVISMSAFERVTELFQCAYANPLSLFDPPSQLDYQMAVLQIGAAVRATVPQAGMPLSQLQSIVIPIAYDAWITVSRSSPSLTFCDLIATHNIANVTKLVTPLDEPIPTSMPGDMNVPATATPAAVHQLLDSDSPPDPALITPWENQPHAPPLPVHKSQPLALPPHTAISLKGPPQLPSPLPQLSLPPQWQLSVHTLPTGPPLPPYEMQRTLTSPYHFHFNLPITYSRIPLAPVPFNAQTQILLHRMDASEEDLIQAHMNLQVNNGAIIYRMVQYPQLYGRVCYIPFPQILFENNYINTSRPPDGLFGLFVGQSTYHTTPLVLHHLFQRVCGINLRYVEAMRRQPASFSYVYVGSEAEQAHAIATLHRRVLFDAHGVWVSRNETEDRALDTFVTTQRPMLYPTVRLPRQRLVVELRSHEVAKYPL